MEKIEKLIMIQQRLNAPKDKVNKFGGYNYRSCESILEAVKPLLKEAGLALIINDEMLALGNRFYVKAEAKLIDANGELVALSTAYAREEDEKKGMDAAQVTGSTSSYARKYALNGLFAIDDNKDADTDEYQETQNAAQKKPAQKPAPQQKPKQDPAPQPKQPAQPLQLTEEEENNYTELCADLDNADCTNTVLAVALMAEGQKYELSIRKKAAKKGIQLAANADEIKKAYALIQDREGWQEMQELAKTTAKTKGFIS